ncbi:MAG: efflux RND transporter periplasmic adaptor subunit [Elusimicrobiales bacterium]|jgi:hypothetical protein
MIPLILCALFSAVPRASAQAGPAVMVGDSEQTIKRGDIEVFAKITGVATAQDTYDIYAPFDGRVEDVMVDLFDQVTVEGVMARLVSIEMAALLDSTNENSRQQTESRWKGVFDYYPIKPPFPGIVTKIHAQAHTKVYKGDRLFTVAKRVVIVGRNTEKLYSNLEPGMTAELASGKNSDLKLKTTLSDFIRLKGSPYFNRLWLEVTTLQTGIRIGGRFDGFLFVGRSEDTMLVPRTALLERSGRKYLIMEVETGLADETLTEILKPGLHFINPRYPKTGEPAKERTDGKDKKID